MWEQTRTPSLPPAEDKEVAETLTVPTYSPSCPFSPLLPGENCTDPPNSRQVPALTWTRPSRGDPMFSR